MSVTRSSSKLFVVNVANAGIGFLAVTVFARELGPAGIGAFFLFQALFRVLESGIDLGLNTAIEKRLSEGASRETILGSGIVLKFAGFLGVVALLLAFRGPVNSYVGEPVAGLLILTVGASQLATIATTTLRGELRVGETAVLFLANQVVYALLGAVFVLGFGMGPIGLIYGVIVGSVVSFLWGIAKLDTRPARPSMASVRSLLSYTKYNIIPALGVQVHSWTDVLIIGLILTQADVGAYEVAWRVAAITLLFPNALGVSLLPQASAFSTSGNRERVGRLISNALLPSVALVIPAVFGTLVFAREILGLLFGPEYAAASLVLVVLIAGKVPEAVQTVVGRVLLGIDRPDLVARATVVSTVLNIVLNVALIPRYGLIGAAVATTFAFTVGMVQRAWYLRTEIAYRLPVGNVLRVTAVSAVMGGVLVGVQSVVTVSDVPGLVGVVLVGVVTFVAGILAVPTLRALALDYVRTYRRG
ncbi:flippase [Salinigranum rubrum]|nr:flippase [Salinigranum rubrum]